MLKVMTIVGTRPELIRLSRVIHRLDGTFDHVLVHTGQNYDYTLNAIFFHELGIRKPDHLLGVDVSTLGHVLGDTLIRTEEILQLEKPNAVLVLGDTNSCIAALMAKRMRIPVYHMEAGNRCFDENVPEETNRRMVDHLADFNLVYTEHARRNLLTEGLHPRRILLTGSPMTEVLEYYRPRIEASRVLDEMGLKDGEYFLVSAHREENVDPPGRLVQLLECLNAVRKKWGLPIVVSTHPRTRKRIEALPGWTAPEGITFHEPFGFHSYNRLQLGAACVLSDSGTIAEESTILQFPAITLRDSIERPEALDTGGIMMTDLHSQNVVEAVRIAITRVTEADPIDLVPTEYRIRNTSDRVVKFLMSTALRHFEWSGLRPQ